MKPWQQRVASIPESFRYLSAKERRINSGQSPPGVEPHKPHEQCDKPEQGNAASEEETVHTYTSALRAQVNSSTL